jgi:hypothetical protein
VVGDVEVTVTLFPFSSLPFPFQKIREVKVGLLCGESAVQWKSGAGDEQKRP